MTIIGGPHQSAIDRRNSGSSTNCIGHSSNTKSRGAGATRSENPLSQHMALMELLRPKVQPRGSAQSAIGKGGSAKRVNSVLAAGDGHRRPSTDRSLAASKQKCLEGSSAAAGVSVSRRARAMGAKAEAAAPEPAISSVARRDSCSGRLVAGVVRGRGGHGVVRRNGGQANGGGRREDRAAVQGHDRMQAAHSAGGRIESTESTKVDSVSESDGRPGGALGGGRAGVGGGGLRDGRVCDNVAESDEREQPDDSDDNSPYTPERRRASRAGAASGRASVRMKDTATSGCPSLYGGGHPSAKGDAASSLSTSSAGRSPGRSPGRENRAGGFLGESRAGVQGRKDRRSASGLSLTAATGTFGGSSGSAGRAGTRLVGRGGGNGAAAAAAAVPTGAAAASGSASSSTAADEAGLAVAMMDIIMSGSFSTATGSLDGPSEGGLHRGGHDDDAVGALAGRIVNTVGGNDARGRASSSALRGSSLGAVSSPAAAPPTCMKSSSATATVGEFTGGGICGPGLVASSGRQQSGMQGDWRLRASRAVGKVRQEGRSPTAETIARGALSGGSCSDTAAADGTGTRAGAENVGGSRESSGLHLREESGARGQEHGRGDIGSAVVGEESRNAPRKVSPSNGSAATATAAEAPTSRDTTTDGAIPPNLFLSPRACRRSESLGGGDSPPRKNPAPRRGLSVSRTTRVSDSEEEDDGRGGRNDGGGGSGGREDSRDGTGSGVVRSMETSASGRRTGPLRTGGGGGGGVKQKKKPAKKLEVSLFAV